MTDDSDQIHPLDRIREQLRSLDDPDTGEVILTAGEARELLVDCDDAVHWREKVRKAYWSFKRGDSDAGGAFRMMLGGFKKRTGPNPRDDRRAIIDRYLYLTRQLFEEFTEPNSDFQWLESPHGKMTTGEALEKIAVEFPFDSTRGAWDLLDAYRHRVKSGAILVQHHEKWFTLPQKPG